MVDLRSQKFSWLPRVGWEGSVLWKDFRHQRGPHTGPEMGVQGNISRSGSGSGKAFILQENIHLTNIY